MKILLTGANGYIGHFVSNRLSELNIDFVIATRDSFDYDNLSSIRKYWEMENISHVIHLAGSVSNDKSNELFNINIWGLYNLLMVCIEKKVSHFTFVSSNNVYGSNKEEFEETDKLQPNWTNIYGLSKYVGELIVSDFCGFHNLNFANVRVADVYGPGQRHGNLMKTIVYSIANNKPLVMHGQGKRKRDYIYVEDVADGLIHIATNCLEGEYNLGTGVGTTVEQLLNIANSIYENKLDIQYKTLEDEDTSTVVLNIRKLSDTGFTVKYTLEQGLRKLLKGDINE